MRGARLRNISDVRVAPVSGVYTFLTIPVDQVLSAQSSENLARATERGAGAGSGASAAAGRRPSLAGNSSNSSINADGSSSSGNSAGGHGQSRFGVPAGSAAAPPSASGSRGTMSSGSLTRLFRNLVTGGRSNATASASSESVAISTPVLVHASNRGTVTPLTQYVAATATASSASATAGAAHDTTTEAGTVTVRPPPPTVPLHDLIRRMSVWQRRRAPRQQPRGPSTDPDALCSLVGAGVCWLRTRRGVGSRPSTLVCPAVQPRRSARPSRQRRRRPKRP